MADMMFFSIEPILSRGCFMNLVISARGAGKTYAVKKRILERFQMFGETGAVVRRNPEEIMFAKRNMWNDIIDNFGLETRTNGYIGYARAKKPVEFDDWEKETRREWEEANPWKEMCYYMSVSEAQTYKGSSFPTVGTILFDEFIIENRRHQYIPGEVDLFIGLVDTIVRNRPSVKVILLSNAGYVNNPYFAYYDIKSSDFDNSEYVFRNDRNVVFQMYKNAHNSEVRRDTIVGKISNETYQTYALDAEWKDGGDSMVAPRPSGSEPRMKLTYDGGKYITLYKAKGSIWWATTEDRESVTKAFCMNSRATIEGVPFSAEIKRQLKELIANRKIIFLDADTRERFVQWVLGV